MLEEKQPSAFETTQWSLVVTARDRSSLAARQAFDGLARIYWKPLYAYVRRRGHSVEESEDLVQGFFAQCLEKDYLEAVHEQKGRFRAFLLICIKRYMADEYDKRTAQKRGGGARAVPIDAVAAESTILARVQTLESPDRAFDRAWAITVLDEALARLARAYEERGDHDTYALIQPRLVGDDSRSYGELAEKLDLSEAAVRKKVERLRKQYKEHVRRVIRDSLNESSDVDDELRILFEALG